MAKADRCLAGAAANLARGDTEDATGRAYYAMYNAAHAALMAAGIETAATPIKTHDGLIGQFGLHLVKTGQLDAQHGRALAQVQDVRITADYASTPPSTKETEWAIGLATAFLAAIRAAFPTIDAAP